MTTDPTAAEITALREQLAEAREHWRQVADASEHPSERNPSNVRA